MLNRVSGESCGRLVNFPEACLEPLGIEPLYARPDRQPSWLGRLAASIPILPVIHVPVESLGLNSQQTRVIAKLRLSPNGSVEMQTVTKIHAEECRVEQLEPLAYDIPTSGHRDGIGRSTKYKAINPDPDKREGLPFLKSF